MDILERHYKALVDIHTQLATVQEQLKSLSAQIKANKSDTGEAIDRIETRVSILEDRINALETDLDKRSGFREYLSLLLGLISALIAIGSAIFIYK